MPSRIFFTVTARGGGWPRTVWTCWPTVPVSRQCGAQLAEKTTSIWLCLFPTLQWPRQHQHQGHHYQGDLETDKASPPAPTADEEEERTRQLESYSTSSQSHPGAHQAGVQPLQQQVHLVSVLKNYHYHVFSKFLCSLIYNLNSL